MIYTFPNVASETEADIYAASICLPKIWNPQPTITDQSEIHAAAGQIPLRISDGCANNVNGKAICLRVIRSLVSAALYRHRIIPGFDQPSILKTAGNGRGRARLQCMLDVGVAAASGLALPACRNELE